jgi:hypothetical protein
MLGILGLIIGFFALIWAGIAATVGVALIFVFLIPLIALAVLFRLGFALFKFAAVLLLLGFAAMWLI